MRVEVPYRSEKRIRMSVSALPSLVSSFAFTLLYFARVAIKLLYQH
jgi:hypothetical protein